MQSNILSRPFIYLALSGIIGLILIIAITLAATIIQKPDMLYKEFGPLENLSVALWLLSAFAAAAAYRRWPSRTDRLVSFWIALTACLAALREVDAHFLLNPVVIGQFGIRFRIDWLLDPHVHILHKLTCIVVALIILGAILAPPFLMRTRFWRLLRTGDASIGMLVVATVCLGMGFVMDDLLRYTPLMTKSTRMLIEESSECLGAVAFLACSLLLLRVPISERLGDQPSP